MGDFLTKHRESLVVGTLASIAAAGITGLISILSALPPVEVPTWVLGAAAAFPAVWLYLRRPGREHTVIVGKKYGIERVYVTGRHFVNCEFRGSELVFDGKRGFSLQGCGFSSPHFTAEGPAANTLSVLAAMYREPGFRRYIDGTIEQIRSGGAAPNSPPSS